MVHDWVDEEGEGSLRSSAPSSGVGSAVVVVVVVVVCCFGFDLKEKREEPPERNEKGEPPREARDLLDAEIEDVDSGLEEGLVLRGTGRVVRGLRRGNVFALTGLSMTSMASRSSSQVMTLMGVIFLPARASPAGQNFGGDGCILNDER